MKRILLQAILLWGVAFLFTESLFAQLSFGGQPKAIHTSSSLLRSSESPISIDVPFSVEDLLATAEWNQGMMTVGRVLPTDLDFFDEAESFYAEDGTLCYRLTLKAREARGLLVAFQDFRLPEGGRFYVFSANQLLGAFTKDSNPRGGFFTIAPLVGDQITLQYEAPKEKGTASIKMDHLGYLFRLEGTTLQYLGKEGSSTNCEVNVNCPEGDKTRDQQNAVVQLLCKVGEVYGACSGTIVNNTLEDFTPYVLTAAHCGGTTNPLPASDYRSWIFTFHYEKPDCRNNYQLAEKFLTLTGCEMVSFLALKEKSDGLLVKLTNDIPDYYGVYYAGWDRSEEIGETHIGLHHPNGDVMKVSSSFEKPTLFTYKDKGGYSGGEDAFLKVIYGKTENGHGVTEGGSSGSALFNEEGLLVGTLTGGASTCSYSSGSNVYGRFAYHWNKYQAEGKSLASVLDPKGNGTAQRLEGRYKVGSSLAQIHPLQGLKVTPSYEGAKQQVKFEWINNPIPTQTAGWKLYIYKEADDKPIASLPLTASTWQDEISETTTGTILYTFRYGYTPSGATSPILFAPRRLSLLTKSPAPVRNLALRESGGKTMITWKRPINFQRVTNISPDAKNFTRLNDYRDGNSPIFKKPIKTVYGGSLFNGLELLPVVGKKIVAIGFVTARSQIAHSYNVFVREGIHLDPSKSYEMADDTHETYIEKAVTGKYNELERKEVLLDNPFTIKGNDLLVVGVKTDTKTNFDTRVLTVVPQGLPTALKNGVANHYHNEIGLPPYRNRWFPFTECFVQEPEKQDGYSTTSFVLCDAPDGESIALPSGMPYGPFPMLFPKLKGYRIEKEGKEVETLYDTAITEYEVAEKGNYTVTPLYEGYMDGEATKGLENVVSESGLKVFPTYFSDRIILENALPLQKVSLYSFEGSLIKDIVFEEGVIRQEIILEELPSGGYLLVAIATDGTSFMQRIYKK